MNPLSKVFRATPPRAGVGLQSIRGYGANLDWPASYTSAWPFLDVMKQSPGIGPPAGATIDANGWPQGMANSQSVSFVMADSLEVTQGYFPPGNYKARFPAALAGAGWTVRFVNNGAPLSSVSGAGATATCTVDDQGFDGTYHGLRLEVVATAPSSGGPHHLTGLQIYKANGTFAASEALLDSGEIFDPGFLADLAGIKLIRVKDWLGTDGAFESDPQFGNVQRAVCNYSEFATESSRSWNQQTGRAPFWGNVPISVCAKLAKKLNCGLFIAMPLMNDRITYAYTASSGTFTATKHDFPAGAQILLSGSPVPSSHAAFTVYYARDVVPQVSFTLSATLGGPAITGGADFDGTAYISFASRLYTEAQHQALYDAMALELHTAAPDITIVPDAGNECWNGAQGIYGYDQCQTVLTKHTPYQNAGSGYAWTLMRVWTALEKYYPRPQIVRMFSAQGVNFDSIGSTGYPYTDATLYGGERIANLIDAHCTNSYAYGTLTGERYPAHDILNFTGALMALVGSSYEFANPGQLYEVGDIVHMSDGTNYRCILQHSSHTPPNATYWVVHSTNGLIGPCSTWTQAQMLEYGILCNKAMVRYHTAYKASANALRTNGLPCGYITYEGNMYWGNEFPLAGLGSWVKDQVIPWMKTASYKQWLQSYHDDMLVPAGISTHTHFMSAGNWTVSLDDSKGSGQQSLKRGHQLPDTLGSAYFKTITL